MRSTRISPIVTTDRMRETRAFWVERLGFAVSFDHQQYLGVRAGDDGAPELGFMQTDADAPEPFGGAGVSVSIAVADADAECERLRRAGVTIHREPSDQPWGARSFMVVDPNGVTVFIAHRIEAAPEFAACVR
ncbi:MAG: VOC family protein [Planctomycetes bacterium]|nr:VOC family protein [Planctomycetota bacterium]